VVRWAVFWRFVHGPLRPCDEKRFLRRQRPQAGATSKRLCGSFLRMSRMKKTYPVLALISLALAAGGGYWWWSQRSAADAVQYRTAKIERGNLQATVSASGAVNPVTQVSVGTQVSGQIKDLYVDFNSEVKAGQLIARIDPETFEYRVRSAQADVDAANAAVVTAQAAAAASRANVSRAQVDLQEAQRDQERKQTLVEKQFIAQSEGDKARALVNTAGELVKQAQAQAGVTEAQIKSAQANVAQRESSLAQARIDLARTRITSPVNGIVIKRAIERGQTVAASLQSPELFVIAQNLSDMQVDASIDESDVGRIRTGQRATFTVDAFPGQTFEGEVRQVRKAAQSVANVVTYVAVVGFSNAGGRLLPGMTANVRVVTDVRENVLKVPNAALRVRIAGIEPAAAAASEPAATPGAPASAASSTSTSSNNWTWFSQALAQPAGGGGQGGGPGGGMAAQRERLVTELQLSAEQQTKLDAIGADLRPRFMALRDLPQDQRAEARDKVSADMRAQISAMLTPAQRSKYQQILAQAPGGPPPGAGGRPAPGNPGVAGPAAADAPKNIAGNEAATRPGGQKPSTNSAASGSVAPGGGAAAPALPANGNPMIEFRNRLVAELALSPAQADKVDAIYAEARPRFGALRDLTAEERPKARERISSDIRARIADVLTAEQKTKYAALVAALAGRQSTRGRIYLMGADGKPVAYAVRLGISDGSSTELLLGPNAPQAAVLKEGALVIIGTLATGTAPGGGPTGPRLPF
jgi:HlyD family secretion protein